MCADASRSDKIGMTILGLTDPEKSAGADGYDLLEAESVVVVTAYVSVYDVNEMVMVSTCYVVEAGTAVFEFV